MNTSAELPRKLGAVDAMAIVMGVMIGSAIFIVPGSIARTLPSPSAILAVWIFAGVISLFGALSFAELDAMRPETGGQYAHIRDAFGPFWAFMFGWALFLVIRSGGTATLGVGFAIYLGQFIPLTPLGAKAAAVGIIALLTWVNYRGVRLGAGVQNTLTALKVIGLLFVIVAPLALSGPSATDWFARPAEFTWSAAGVVMIACLWAYQGWFSVSWVAGEVRRPERNLPIALGLGVSTVILLYVAANVSYLRTMPIAEIARTDRVAAAVVSQVVGPSGAVLISLIILVSISGAINGGLLAAPRVYFAQARDGLFFRRFAEIHPRYHTPGFAIAGQGLWGALLAATGSYQMLMSYTIFASWIFYALTVAAVPVLRRRHPEWPRPYRTWGYPVTPLLFVVVAATFVVSTVFAAPVPSLIGLAIVASGVPAYWLFRRRGIAAPPSSSVADPIL